MKLEVLNNYVAFEKMTLDYDQYLTAVVPLYEFFLLFTHKHKIGKTKLLVVLKENLKRYSRLSSSSEEDNVEALFENAILSFLEKDRRKEILVNNYIKSFLYPQFALAKTLQDVLGKKRGLALYAKFVNNRIKKTKFSEVKEVKDLLFMNMKEIRPPMKNSFNRIDFELDKGRAGCKVVKCRWHQVLKELNDPETAYVVACHWDFAAAKGMNKNFRLTRNITLIEGKSCCDFIWHDLRFKKKLVHADEIFWRSLK